MQIRRCSLVNPVSARRPSSRGSRVLIELEPEKVPARLRGSHIVQLQMGGIVAGTMLRGMFEERIKGIIDEVKERDNLILFIDEAHTIIGAGAALGTSSDAANMFKSALARGEMRIIGATTISEYKEYIADDEALARRFRLVKVVRTVDHRNARDSAGSASASREELLGQDLRRSDQHRAGDGAEVHSQSAPAGQSHRLARHGGGQGRDQRAANDDRQARTRYRRDLAGIAYSARHDLSRHGDRFAMTEAMLGKRVIGQKEAIKAVAQRLRLNKGPLKESHYKPDGVLLFLGPTGVGKTELAKAVAEFMFGDEEKMVRIDMSEYSDGTVSIEKLIGMPRGIVGSERGGILTEQLRENPYTVLLLDEVEKASPYLMNLFLQAFDEGWLTDGRGKKVYLSDAIVIMTSNLGSESFKKFEKPLGFGTKTAGRLPRGQERSDEGGRTAFLA